MLLLIQKKKIFLSVQSKACDKVSHWTSELQKNYKQNLDMTLFLFLYANYLVSDAKGKYIGNISKLWIFFEKFLIERVIE